LGPEQAGQDKSQGLGISIALIREYTFGFVLVLVQLLPLPCAQG
jgi:hypothetical protein